MPRDVFQGFLTGPAVSIVAFTTEVSMAPHSNSQVSHSLYSSPAASKLEKERMQNEVIPDGKLENYSRK